MLQVQASAGNRAVSTAVQRAYVPTRSEELDYASLIPRTWGASGAAVDGAILLVTRWCQSHAQFQSLVQNVTWAEFLAMTKKYKDGKDVPVKAGAIRAKMEKEMQQELAAIRQAQIDHLRATGQPGAGRTLTDWHTDTIIGGLAHTLTFRTQDEKAKKKGNPTGPFTRNFSVEVDGAPALWEIHVHYRDSKDQRVEKAHVKLISKRHEHERVRDLPALHSLVVAASAVIQPQRDSSLKDL
ncbi:hypothetical protein [Cellulosimicrobium marinum]|uniref:hypothetical protein n=1 Tax=Cellulosimicrobium marinum TaxID=1638992 RepID=UPI001E5A3747|nr:hypothetical protein [Cellulosimicrobium marinum]MCB7138142.1 hypothetical protein [Cellulosimicrobium marinum]